MRRPAFPLLLAPALLVGCAAHHDKATPGTLADLRQVKPDLQEARIDEGLEQAMQNYRRFLEETPETAMTPEAIRRLADLKIETQFGIRDGKPKDMAVPEPALAPAASPIGTPGPAAA